MMNVYLSCISQICVSKLKGSKNVVVSSNYYLNQIDEDCDYNDDDDGKEDNVVVLETKLDMMHVLFSGGGWVG